MRRGWRSLIAAGLLAGPASGSVPPMPPDDAPVIAASCGTTKSLQPFDEVPATVTPLSPETLKVEGRLRWRWGLRIATEDPRVADLAGMEVSGPYGLLATTRGDRWLSFDLQGGTLAGIRSIGVATMRGAPGVPTSVVTPSERRTYVAFGGAHPMVARYALAACGAASSAVPMVDVTGAADPIMVQAAFTYLGIVGRRASEGSAFMLSYERKTVALAGRNPLGAVARTLVAASNPARIVPEIIVARRPGHGGRTDVTLVPVEAWDDVRGGPPRPQTPLAKGCDAIAAAWAASRGVPLVAFTPQVARYGKRAGFVRNKQLADLRPVEAIVCQGSGLQSNLLDTLKAANIATHAFRIDQQAPAPVAIKRQAFG